MEIGIAEADVYEYQTNVLAHDLQVLLVITILGQDNCQRFA